MEFIVKVMYEDILVGDIRTNQSLSVDSALDILEFDEQAFIEEHDLDDIDYGHFELLYS